jgi:hypothetical protein
MKKHRTESPAEAIARYGFTMCCLVQEKIEETGREAEIRALLEQGFQFLFTFSPEAGSLGHRGQIGAALFHPETRRTVPILSLELVDQPRESPSGISLQ